MALTSREVLAQVDPSLAAHGRVVLCQIVRVEGSTPGKVGWKLLARPDGSFVGNLGGGAFEALVKRDAQSKLAGTGDGGGESEIRRYYLTEEAVKGEPTGMVCGGMAEVFLEVVTAPAVLVVCGGGPVGQAIAKAGVLAGFEILVADDREAFRQPELFPAGARFAWVKHGYDEEFLAPFRFRDLYIAVVTRCWETDTAALASILRQAPPQLHYLGLMGSRRKVQRVQDALAARGVTLAGQTLHAPIGLPVGGDSPGEIAISVLAEILSVRYQEAADA